MKWIYNKYLSKKSRATFFLSLLIGLTPIFVLSCNEDYLDILPTDSYTDAVVFDDPALAEAFVNYAYRLLPWGFKGAGWTMPLSFVIDENSARLSSASVGTLVRGEINPSYLGALDMWSDQDNRGRSYWPAIRQCNEFLEKTEESTLDHELLSSLRAQARTIRAYAYYRLVSYFGGVPLITVPFTLDSDWRVGRNSYDEVMNFVFDELDDVINLLPLDYPALEKGKVTKGAAMAIKARALLYYASPLNNPANDLSRWQAAADAAKAIIDLGIYELYPDYKELFMEAGGYNSEVIWGRRTNSQIDREARIEQVFYPNGWRGFGQIHPIQNLVDDYEMTDGLLPKDSPMYDPQDPYVNRDPRFYYTILYDGAPFKERTIETFFPGGRDSNEGPISAWNATETGYYPRKFITEEKTGFGWDGTANSDPLWLWFRYGEILLIYAEAMYFLGDEDTSREYINIIRSRSGVEMPPVTESGEELFDRLVNERRIEMVFEEQRYFDVRRWKIAPDVLNRDRNRMYIWKDPVTGNRTFEVRFFQEANFHERNYLLPIPQSEIDRNALLEQNPGYN
jgi:starch-binding outer membrane protein, SusD/RagB family